MGLVGWVFLLLLVVCLVLFVCVCFCCFVGFVVFLGGGMFLIPTPFRFSEISFFSVESDNTSG